MKGIIFKTGGISLREKLNRDNLPSPFPIIIYEFQKNTAAQVNRLLANILLLHMQRLVIRPYT